MLQFVKMPLRVTVIWSDLQLLPALSVPCASRIADLRFSLSWPIVFVKSYQYQGDWNGL